MVGLLILLAVSALGIVPALLKRGATMYSLILLFVVSNAALLLKVERDLAAVGEPGPDARGIAALFFIPTVAFAAAGGARLLLEFVRYVRRNMRARS